MNKSILTTSLIASSRLYAKVRTTIPKNNTNKAYKWQIETEIGIFTGICPTINAVNKEITMLTNNARILKKNIIPMILTNEDPEHKIYSWNVITNNSNVTGESTSLKEAQRAVKSFGTTEVLKSNIVESLNTSK